VIGVLMTGLNVALTIVLKQFGIYPKPIFDPTHWEIASSDVVGLAILIGIWEALYFLICRYQRRQNARWKLEGDLTTAELRALKAQLNPHFLFNCLNGLRALIVEDPERAQHVVTRLASVLRYSLQSSSTPTVSLECELQTVDDYLELEAIRFEERLRVRRQIDPATLTTQVPPMVVQTLVENAVKYGVSKSPEPGEILIASSLTNEGVVITVANNGRIESASNSTGLGLANAMDRLRHLFGPTASVSLEQSSPEVVTATIRLPAPNYAVTATTS
jgi:LytS/YehU family sensor histidine kinase